MTKIIPSEDCGNSPKNIFVQDLTIAFGKGDSKYILESVTDDIRWNLVGDKSILGKGDVAESLNLNRKNSDTVMEMTIHQGSERPLRSTRELCQMNYPAASGRGIAPLKQFKLLDM